MRNEYREYLIFIFLSEAFSWKRTKCGIIRQPKKQVHQPSWCPGFQSPVAGISNSVSRGIPYKQWKVLRPIPHWFVPHELQLSWLQLRFRCGAIVWKAQIHISLCARTYMYELSAMQKHTLSETPHFPVFYPLFITHYSLFIEEQIAAAIYSSVMVCLTTSSMVVMPS